MNKFAGYACFRAELRLKVQTRCRPCPPGPQTRGDTVMDDRLAR